MDKIEVREINLQGLIPELDDCQGAYIERRIGNEIGMSLYENGQVMLRINEWSPQHIDVILSKVKEKGYVIIDNTDYTSIPHYIIQLPEFIIEERIMGGADAE